jgi:hypothetical protein
MAALATPSFGNHIKVIGILYLHDITDPLSQPSPHYEIFRKICGYQYLSSVVLVLTMCEHLNPASCQERRKDLINHWKMKMGEKATVYSHYGSKKSAWDVVTALGVPDASEVSFFCSQKILVRDFFS